MSSETWQQIAQLLALSPWLAFVVAIVWFWVLTVRDNARVSRVDERARPRRSEKPVERTLTRTNR